VQEDGPRKPHRPFTLAGIHGEVADRYWSEDLAEEARRIIDPSAAVETIHWGRNYLYAAEFRTASDAVPVVVKQFRNQGWRRSFERRLKGSKAARSWRVATEMVDAGVPTPEPILLVESDLLSGPSFLITRRLERVYELRHFFRRLNNEPAAGYFPEIGALPMLVQLGRFCRAMHDAGILHRDLSIGNVLAQPRHNSELALFVVDCNRARTGQRFGVLRRCRDVCRFPVLRTPHRQAFLAGYWGDVPARSDPRWWFWVLSVRGFLLKHAIKNRLRRFTLRRRHAHGGGHHPHIPAAAVDASSRDKAVWDKLSDQPHQHASSWEKRAIRLRDAPDHLSDTAVMLAALPAAWRRYRSLKRSMYSEAIAFDGIGVCLRPWTENPRAQLEAVETLGLSRVLVRLHPWAEDHGAEEALVRALHERGHEVAFAIPQNRELVRDPKRWCAAVEEIAERFSPFGSYFQLGQAPNRSKWGVWNRREYVNLFVAAAEILRRRPGVQLLGPAVIDFEFPITLALVNRKRQGLRFDAMSSLLYVDRRGAPESRQMGLDTLDKVVLLKAISEVGRNSSGRSWITEVNWPLWEGPHSPAGRSVSVDESTQADYLTRYFLLALGTGLVERIYWWQMVARGYGLIAPEADGALRRRPSFEALRTLNRELGGAVFLGPLPTVEGMYLYRFQRAGRELLVGWSVAPGTIAVLPRPALRAMNRDGHDIETPDGIQVTLGPSPQYYVLAE
jgi:tRNA A-37 threonylcarbamoyl transferase component Bud32